MGEVQGQGYIAQALDIADVLAVAYFHAMRFRPEEPSWEDRDRFLLSNGHYAIALYAALIEAGIVPEAELETYGFDESRLPMSGMASYTPGMEMSGGSLGLGLSIAVGMGLGLKRKGSSSRVYTLFSDGELDEGSKWEAMMSAAHHKLDNLIAIIDVNNQQADGPSKQMMGFEPLVDKLEAFGWFVRRVDGNDLDAVVAAFDAARSHTEPQPRVIVADTLMGKEFRSSSSAKRTISSGSSRTNGSSRWQNSMRETDHEVGKLSYARETAAHHLCNDRVDRV